jgi:hypothetical protein
MRRIALLATLACLLILPASAPADDELLGSGAWLYHSDPRAVHHRGITYTGWITTNGNVRVAAINHATGRVTRRTIMEGLGVDDHHYPVFHVRSDGRIMAFYSTHSGKYLPKGRPSRMYYRITTRPRDIRSWSRTRTIPTNTPGGWGHTYPNVVRADGKLWLFWRGGNWWPTFATSTDGGRSWSRARNMVLGRIGNKPYFKYAGRGGAIHMAYTPNTPDAANTTVYYAQWRNGRLYGADGRRLGRRPLASNAGQPIYRYSRSRGRGWVYDIATDAEGRPAILYLTGYERKNPVFWYAKWTGTEWKRTRMTSAGELRRRVFTTGGGTLDHDDPDTVYLSRAVDGVNQVEVWRTEDDGATWTSTPVTSGSVPSFRPVSPRGLTAFPFVIYLNGRYRSWLSYERVRVRTTDEAPFFEPRPLSEPGVGGPPPVG